MTKIAQDGLEALRAEIGIAEIARLIERTARWVDPATFRLLPVWFPEHARGRHFYKNGWSEPLMNTTKASSTTVHKREGNIYANQALTLALGLAKADRPNWSCCHIWGIDDATFQAANAVVQDRRFYSCVGNMVLLPTPLKAFTDTMPEIKAMLRMCARNLYGWHCDHEGLLSVHEALDGWADWESYPASWPRSPGEKLPLGVVLLDANIEALAAKRLLRIWDDLQNAGSFYPRDEVLAVLAYWGIQATAPELAAGKIPDPSRFAATVDGVRPAGRYIGSRDALTDQERADNAEHERLLEEVRSSLKAAATEQ